jgi:hypothetical protein
METQVAILLVNIFFLIVFVVMHQINKKLFYSILSIPLADRFIKVDEFETSNKKISYTLFFTLIFFAVALAIHYYNLKLNIPILKNYQFINDKHFSFILWSLIIGASLLLKALIDFAAFYILDISYTVRTFIKYKLLLMNYCLVIVVPVILFNEYNELNLYIKFDELLIALLIIYIFGQLIYIFKYSKRFLNNLHYIILYLCAFEFGIYFVIYKMTID